MAKYSSNQGFSLIEIAIVLIAVSLLVGGIMVGRTLLDKTQTRTIATDINTIHEAMAQFQNTYNALPGDMHNADERLGAFAGIATVNGDGDGILEPAEYPNVWQHLALAGLLEGEFDPTSPAPNIGVPEAQFGPNISLEIMTEPTSGEVAIGISRFDETAAATGSGFLTPKQAMQLDEKFDDGNPDTGRMRAYTDAGAGGNCKNAGLYMMNDNRANCFLTFTSSAIDEASSAEAIVATNTQITECEPGSGIGSTKTVPCPNGTGAYDLICREGGVWEADESTANNCDETGCTSQSMNDNSGVSASYPSTPIGNVAKGNCPGGMGGYNASNNLDLSGSPSMRCYAPGGAAGWRYASPQMPAGVCDAYCNSTTLPTTGTLTSIPRPFNMGHAGRAGPVIVTLSCTSGFSNAHTPGTQVQDVVCHSSGNWTTDTSGASLSAVTLNCQPNCDIASVPGYDSTRHTPGLGTTWKRGENLTIECQSGYIYASSSVTCNTDGTIGGTAPSCLASCQKMDGTDGTTPHMWEPGYTTNIPAGTEGQNYTPACPAGMVGSPTFTCQSNGVWGLTAGGCTPQSCSALPSVANGTVSCSDGNNHLSGCTLTCGYDFALNGNHTTLCEYGNWSDTLGTCEAADCWTITPPENSSVTCTNGTAHGSVCSFSCDPGYSLTSSHDLTCNSADWVPMVPPQCEPDPCSSSMTTAPSNGSVTCSDSNNHDSTCSFSCNSGYTRSGAASSTCSSGSWSNTKPTCNVSYAGCNDGYVYRTDSGTTRRGTWNQPDDPGTHWRDGVYDDSCRITIGYQPHGTTFVVNYNMGGCNSHGTCSDCRPGYCGVWGSFSMKEYNCTASCHDGVWHVAGCYVPCP